MYHFMKIISISIVILLNSCQLTSSTSLGDNQETSFLKTAGYDGKTDSGRMKCSFLLNRAKELSFHTEHNQIGLGLLAKLCHVSINKTDSDLGNESDSCDHNFEEYEQAMAELKHLWNTSLPPWIIKEPVLNEPAKTAMEITQELSLRAAIYGVLFQSVKDKKFFQMIVLLDSIPKINAWPSLLNWIDVKKDDSTGLAYLEWIVKGLIAIAFIKVLLQIIFSRNAGFQVSFSTTIGADSSEDSSDESDDSSSDEEVDEDKFMEYMKGLKKSSRQCSESLSGIENALQRLDVAKYLPDIKEALCDSLLKCLRSKDFFVPDQAAGCLCLVAVQLRSKCSGLCDKIYSVLLPLMQDDTTHYRTRGACAITLATWCFLCSDDLEKVKTLSKALEEIICFGYRKGEDRPSLTITQRILITKALNAWCLMLTISPKPMIQAHMTNHLDSLKELWKYSDDDLRITAGEAIILLYDLTGGLENDVKHEDEATLGEMLHKMASDAVKRRAKREFLDGALFWAIERNAVSMIIYAAAFKARTKARAIKDSANQPAQSLPEAVIS
ncbi:uncharacterized protein LOC131957465 [Physella acuta]|uniref:uncharacterized protein LOC131957465 n=1 Tax=Physella acuta TaxID=109671 RepID=UPI0027DE7895|nr:uncharacterized protein LOC131957465 [Physella acuta]